MLKANVAFHHAIALFPGIVRAVKESCSPPNISSAVKAQLKIARYAEHSGGSCRASDRVPGKHSSEDGKSRQGRLKLTMSHLMSYHARSSILVHCVFTTKNRVPSIPADMQPRLWSYMGGIARTNNRKALAVGGIADHCHILLSLPPTIMVSKAVQLVKSGSSKWMNEQAAHRRFSWQEGYGAFTIGMSQMPATVRYIANQEKHHARISFQDEWKMILQKHGLSPDEA
jgi:putative transposase